MKTKTSFRVITAALGLFGLVTAGCAKPVEKTTAALPVVNGVAAAPVAEAVPAAPSTRVTQWSEIKDCTYESRARFHTGLAQLEAQVDTQITELSAKRATLGSMVDTQGWDFAMKEMVEARAYLKSTGEVLVKTPRETWAQQKDRVNEAWVRTQDAYGKVKSSTTS